MIINDNNVKNNEDKVSNFKELGFSSNNFANKNEKRLVKKRKRKRIRNKNEKSPINFLINNNNLYLSNNLNIKNNKNIKKKEGFKTVNKHNKFHPPFRDDNDDSPLKLFDNKKSKRINKKIFKKKLKIIYK